MKSLGFHSLDPFLVRYESSLHVPLYTWMSDTADVIQSGDFRICPRIGIGILGGKERGCLCNRTALSICQRGFWWPAAYTTNVSVWVARVGDRWGIQFQMRVHRAWQS